MIPALKGSENGFNVDEQRDLFLALQTLKYVENILNLLSHHLGPVLHLSRMIPEQVPLIADCCWIQPKALITTK